MPLEGDLSDFSLSSLLQLASLEAKDLEITVRRPGQEGRLFLVGDVVVDAVMGSRRGPEVAYELLDWKSGSFVAEQTLERRDPTVGLSWSYILLEAARRSDEGAHASGILPGGGSEGGVWQDEYEDQLFVLLSELEQHINPPSDTHATLRPVDALNTLVTTINRVLEFAESLPTMDPERVAPTALFRRVASHHPLIHLLHIQDNRVSPDTAMAMYQHWKGGAAERNHLFEGLCLSLVAVVDTALERLGSLFESSDRVRSWRETYKTLSMDAARSVSRVTYS